MDSEAKGDEAERRRAMDLSASDVGSSDNDNDNGNDSDDGQAQARQVEWLATTRQRRATAGNRMKAMLANEEPDSDLELLFAEDENDDGFTDVGEDGSDVHMDSSSDDDDANHAADDLEGEKELERQAKERRAAQRKRRAHDAIPAKFRKKVRIDTATSAPPASVSAPASAPVPRPKKKSERASWLPSPADLPTRASSRQTTRLSKEQLHQQMVEREAKRLKQLAQMQKKAAKLEASKKPPMTQEERLREAAIVEKRNSKSLNRWEEAEKQREEARRAKLAALNERTLKGPVITFWSGMGEWVDGRLKHVGRHVVIEERPEKKKREKKEKGEKAKEKDGEEAENSQGKEAAHGNDKPAVNGSGEDAELNPKAESDPATSKASSPKPDAAPTATSKPAGEGRSETTENPESVPEKAPIPASSSPVEEAPRVMAMPPQPPPPSGLAALAPAPSPAPALTPSLTPVPPLNRPASVITPPPGLSRPPPDSKPSGVLAPPALAPPPGIGINGSASRIMANPMSNVLAPPDTSQGSVPPAMAAANTPIRPPGLPALSVPSLSPAAPPKPGLKQFPGEEPPKTTKTNSKGASSAPREPSPDHPHPPHATATRNAIIFQNFDDNALKDKGIQTQILFGRKMNRLAKPTAAPSCVITNHPARYRDPATGLPYFNAYAYREIQRLRRGDYRWSRLLGAWVGSGSYVARGVPERFLDPKTKPVEKTDTGQDGVKKQAGGKPSPEKSEDAKLDEREDNDEVKPDAAELKREQVQPVAATT